MMICGAFLISRYYSDGHSEFEAFRGELDVTGWRHHGNTWTKTNSACDTYVEQFPSMQEATEMYRRMTRED